MIPKVKSTHPISGERFTVRYRLAGHEQDAYQKALDICLEQTVEIPDSLVPAGLIREEILGRIESFDPVPDGGFMAAISYALEIAGGELTQLLNVIFGNISIKPGIRVERLELPEAMLRTFPGPRYGRQGLREQLGISGRPLLCTALKPLGLPAEGLAMLAYQFALGGIDIIKDDHSLADQGFADFQQRVKLCTAAVERANRKTGGHSIYMPNVTATFEHILARAAFAKRHGAGGLLIAPGLTGFDALSRLAADESLALPIFSHPAFQGTFVLNPDSGVSHRVLFGQLARLAGADAAIYPNYGGRFAFTREECLSIVEGTEMPMGSIKTIFPCPGGGMSLERVPELLEVYGRDVIFLIGGGLFTYGPDLAETCRRFREMVETNGKNK
jgi:ribulose-bisphosphate carboxylase large chain